jgi:hypothetical protein
MGLVKQNMKIIYKSSNYIAEFSNIMQNYEISCKMLKYLATMPTCKILQNIATGREGKIGKTLALRASLYHPARLSKRRGDLFAHRLKRQKIQTSPLPGAKKGAA